MEEIIEIECVVKGKVQAVGYREYARSQALALGVTGFAQNKPDGSVRVVAQAPDLLLERYVKVLRAGPSSAAVDEVKVMLRKMHGRVTDFVLY
ncbi:MAG: hypothetical protein A2928_00185 [Candidatus Taylorbacteria bacterium RIFCSPLOWO2_01_FULL_45_15b]|uniref:acylphosphatase n=1 Tax=Candidatus Taylorbacteria bacterium RIFCSPLOWO2_01_FULL_45_15b TaxID=1802319 RepID=A0A1G2N7C4_9BACT|nr:MAG: hypothetical protein A2928_00185 [Candidatus Taylorbacteria bacterium RIFCSPLOWO2_01_FULL_45_15b]